MKLSHVIKKGCLAKRTLQDVFQERLPTGSDELSLEEQIGLNLVKRPGKNILGGRKNTW